MRITIHRGTHTIGGSCIEISAGGQRIILDIGAALMESGGGEIASEKQAKPSVNNGMLPNIKGLYKGDKPDVAAVFITHSHMDHCGLLDHIHPEIPVFLSQGSKALIEIGRVFYPENSKIHFDHFKIFEHWQPFKEGCFTVTSHLVDHSAYDASALLIEANGKRLFYSGDFRGHGRKRKLLDSLIKKPLKDIDCLVMEGTTLGGKHKGAFASEDEVEQGFLDVFRDQENISFVMAAGSNVDRLVSLYRASKKSGKTLVLDLYSYYLLHRLHQLSSGLPPHDNDHIRIFYIRKHCTAIAEYLGEEVLYRFKHRKIELDEIVRDRANMVVKVPLGTMKKIASRLQAEKTLSNTLYLYSMWQGYLDKDPSHNQFCEAFGIPLQYVHVSGHAYLEDLQALAQAINPKQLIPIHTLSGDDFSAHFDNVMRLDDGETLSL
jgi:ribonuclease J